MQRLIPSLVISQPTFDPVAEYPQDIASIVEAAKRAGFIVTTSNAGELWRRYSEGISATWLAPSSEDDPEIVRHLINFADVVDASTTSPPLPKGYPSWLYYAVDAMDTRSVQIDLLFDDVTSTVSRDDMRAAVRAELDALSRQAAANRDKDST